MMKYCKHCGKELHEESSFCPHCMKTQIEKQTAIIQTKKSNRLLYIFIIGILIILISLSVCKSMFMRNERSDNDTDSTIQSLNPRLLHQQNILLLVSLQQPILN